VFTVKVDPAVPLAAGVTDAGANPQVTVAFTGAIAQLNATAELNPFNDVTVIVAEPEFPAITVAAVGEAVTLKSFTVKLNVAVWVNAPEFPVTVTV
jgi:hypothetical protein